MFSSPPSMRDDDTHDSDAPYGSLNDGTDRAFLCNTQAAEPAVELAQELDEQQLQHDHQHYYRRYQRRLEDDDEQSYFSEAYDTATSLFSSRTSSFQRLLSPPFLPAIPSDVSGVEEVGTGQQSHGLQDREVFVVPEDEMFAFSAPSRQVLPPSAQESAQSAPRSPRVSPPPVHSRLSETGNSLLERADSTDVDTGIHIPIGASRRGSVTVPLTNMYRENAWQWMLTSRKNTAVGVLSARSHGIPTRDQWVGPLPVDVLRQPWEEPVVFGEEVAVAVPAVMPSETSRHVVLGTADFIVAERSHRQNGLSDGMSRVVTGFDVALGTDPQGRLPSSNERLPRRALQTQRFRQAPRQAAEFQSMSVASRKTKAEHVLYYRRHFGIGAVHRCLYHFWRSHMPTPPPQGAHFQLRHLLNAVSNTDVVYSSGSDCCALNTATGRAVMIHGRRSASPVAKIECLHANHGFVATGFYDARVSISDVSPNYDMLRVDGPAETSSQHASHDAFFQDDSSHDDEQGGLCAWHLRRTTVAPIAESSGKTCWRGRKVLSEYLISTDGSDNDIVNCVLIERSSRGLSTASPAADSLSLFTACNDSTVAEWTLDGRELWKVRFPWCTNYIAVAPQRRLMAVAVDSREIPLLDTMSGRVACVLEDHLDFTFCCDWHPDPNSYLLATGNQDETCRVWDIRYPKSALFTIGTACSEVRSVKFSPDGHTLAFLESQDIVAMYDVASQFQEYTIVDFFGRGTGISYSPDSTRFFIGIAGRLGVSSSLSGTIMELRKGHPIATIPSGVKMDDMTSSWALSMLHGPAFGSDSETVARESVIESDKEVFLQDVTTAVPVSAPAVLPTSVTETPADSDVAELPPALEVLLPEAKDRASMRRLLQAAQDDRVSVDDVTQRENRSEANASALEPVAVKVHRSVQQQQCRRSSDLPAEFYREISSEEDAMAVSSKATALLDCPLPDTLSSGWKTYFRDLSGVSRYIYENGLLEVYRQISPIWSQQGTHRGGEGFYQEIHEILRDLFPRALDLEMYSLRPLRGLEDVWTLSRYRRPVLRHEIAGPLDVFTQLHHTAGSEAFAAAITNMDIEFLLHIAGVTVTLQQQSQPSERTVVSQSSSVEGDNTGGTDAIVREDTIRFVEGSRIFREWLSSLAVRPWSCRFLEWSVDTAVHEETTVDLRVPGDIAGHDLRQELGIVSATMAQRPKCLVPYFLPTTPLAIFGCSPATTDDHQNVLWNSERTCEPLLATYILRHVLLTCLDGD